MKAVIIIIGLRSVSASRDVIGDLVMRKERIKSDMSTSIPNRIDDR